MQETEKPSKTRQWQERSDAPLASRPMTPQEIVGFTKTLADSYKCPVSDITYEFKKIQDENDTDRDDCLWLTYNMKCVNAGKPGSRVIFRIKLPIPEEVRRAGEKARRQQAQQGRRRAIMPPPAQASTQTAPTVTTVQTAPTVTTVQTAPTVTTVQTPVQTAPTQSTQVETAAPAPKVRRPAKRK